MTKAPIRKRALFAKKASSHSRDKHLPQEGKSNAKEESFSPELVWAIYSTLYSTLHSSLSILASIVMMVNSSVAIAFLTLKIFPLLSVFTSVYALTVGVYSYSILLHVKIKTEIKNIIFKNKQNSLKNIIFDIEKNETQNIITIILLIIVSIGLFIYISDDIYTLLELRII